jgi:hypothetical protein
MAAEERTNPPPTLRIARPTSHLHAISKMYREGLGLEELGAFEGHDGFDGVILGHPDSPWHLEFTTREGHDSGRAPTEDNLLVFYLPAPHPWSMDCQRMLKAGFREVPAFNPYWDRNGRTFEDMDGYRVVLSQREWNR